MRIEITGHQVDVTPALREYVRSKLERIQRRFENLIDVHVILTVEKLEHKAEASVLASQRTLYADAIATDMYASIDLMSDKLDRQVVKHKEKLKDHHRGAAAVRAANFG
ncbi:MAG TPA: ribosome-associated translation inhibitor RaiA [Xanthomonadaceae bacterium]|nr:ribosome-associated translation inhibitor RaiA [Xanthomonadaceae bacterium]